MVGHDMPLEIIMSQTFDNYTQEILLISVDFFLNFVSQILCVSNVFAIICSLDKGGNERFFLINIFLLPSIEGEPPI
jgi:hypothetical protein